MEKIPQKKTWGEREGVTLELLRKFTKPGCPNFGEVQQVWAYRGDCTESGDRRTRAAIGEEAYEHEHWNAVACTGGVVVVVPRWKFREERGSGPGLGARYWWAMSAIAETVPEDGAGIRAATAAEIAAVVPETQALLAELPGLEYRVIARTSYYSTAKPGKKLWDQAPQDVRYFRFAAGYGCVAIKAEAGK